MFSCRYCFFLFDAGGMKESSTATSFDSRSSQETGILVACFGMSIVMGVIVILLMVAISSSSKSFPNLSGVLRPHKTAESAPGQALRWVRWLGRLWPCM